MQYRKLGRTGLEVSVIGLGTEYLYGQPRETVVSVVREAVERGVNYLDLLFAFAEYRDNFGAALRGLRERVILAGHLGSTEKDGQYCKTRSLKKSEAFFLDLLSRLNTDYVDVLILHNMSTLKDYESATRPGGFVHLAAQLRQEGKARFIGMSTHSVELALQAIESGLIDVLMLPFNLLGNAVPERKELLNLCRQRDVGLVAMKPFGGGKLLQARKTFRAAKYQTGSSHAFKAKITAAITPLQCLSYVLSQVGVSTVIPGVKDNAELAAALYTLQASEAERDFSPILAELGQYAEGECVYCNHCLPCPAFIDIGPINRLLDMALLELAPALRQVYGALPVRASACTQCAACTARCPFGVDVVSRMAQAVQVFESA